MSTAANIITVEGGNFSTMPNELLNDSNISLAAKGLYIFMRGKPAGWNFTIRSMAKQLKEGETALGSAMKELKAAGWMAYTKHSDGTGVYHLYWSAVVVDEPEQENPDQGEPNQENPNQGFAKKGKPRRISKKEPSARKSDNNTDDQLRSPAKKPAANHAGDQQFALAWQHYPKREGSNPKNHALSAWKARLAEGHAPEVMLTGLRRYLSYCQTKGNVGTGFVMQAKRFFGPSLEFLNDWEVSTTSSGNSGMLDPNDTSWIHGDWGY